MESGLPAASDRLELVYGDIAQHSVVEALLEGCVAVVHTTVFFPQQVAGVQQGGVLPDSVADETWTVNLKGLWNVLEAAQRSSTVRRVVRKFFGEHKHSQPC